MRTAFFRLADRRTWIPKRLKLSDESRTPEEPDPNFLIKKRICGVYQLLHRKSEPYLLPVYLSGEVLAPFHS